MVRSQKRSPIYFRGFGPSYRWQILKADSDDDCSAEAGALVLWGKDEQTQILQHGEEAALGGPKATFPYPWARLFTAVHGRIKLNGYKLKQEKFKSYLMKSFFTTRKIKQVDQRGSQSPSSEVYKKELNKSLSSLVPFLSWPYLESVLLLTS